LRADDSTSSQFSRRPDCAGTGLGFKKKVSISTLPPRGSSGIAISRVTLPEVIAGIHAAARNHASSTQSSAASAPGVAAFEFFKGIFVMLMGFCALALVHKDVWLYAESLLALFTSTPTAARPALSRLCRQRDRRATVAAARIAFAYAALRFTEALGLWSVAPGPSG